MKIYVLIHESGDTYDENECKVTCFQKKEDAQKVMRVKAAEVGQTYPDEPEVSHVKGETYESYQDDGDGGHHDNFRIEESELF